MTKILIVTGSIRPNSAGEKLMPVVSEWLKNKNVDVEVADMKELDLPFYNDPLPPSNPEFAPTDERVIQWTKLVEAADGVVFLTPEYNHTMSPVQMNAIDWISKEWRDKPIALIGYGWTSGARQAQETAREALEVNLKARVGRAPANLYFAKDLAPDGSVSDEESVEKKLSVTLNELLDAVKS